MTREDAILHMTLRREELKHSVGDLDEDIEAFDMAIQALEQKPCEDVISRQEAIDAIEKTKAAMATDGEIYVAKINAEMNIQQLPSVSTEKTGHWEKLSVGYGCSECSLCTNILGTIDFKYCPKCGAKMGEVVDEQVDKTIESVDECRFLCRWNKDFKCTKGHYERWCKDKMLGEEGETDE